MNRSVAAAAALALALALALLAASIYGRAGDVITLYHEPPAFEAAWRLDQVPPDRWVGFALDEAGWEALEGLVPGGLGRAEPPDFDRSVALVAYMGERPTGGYAIHISEVAYEERPGGSGKLRVRLAVDSPDPSQFVIQAFTYPLDVALLERKSLPGGFLVRLEAGDLTAEVVDQDGRDWGPLRVARPGR